MIRERLAVNKQESHKFHMDRLNVKKYRVKRSIVLRSQIGLQLWKIWTLRLKLVLSGKRLERISKFQPKRV
jgi:hypothetical protein